MSDKILAALRNDGWTVAVHNDYRMHGNAHTFWLLIHPDGRWIKGEGATDLEALTYAALASEGEPPLKSLKQRILAEITSRIHVNAGDARFGILDADSVEKTADAIMLMFRSAEHEDLVRARRLMADIVSHAPRFPDRGALPDDPACEMEISWRQVNLMRAMTEDRE